MKKSIVLALTAVVIGCASSEEKRSAEPVVNCSSGQQGGEGCAIIGGLMLIFHAGGNPATSAERRSKNSIYGSCYIIVGHAAKQSCQDVAIEVNGGDIKGYKVWVQGDHFEITGLKPGRYSLDAYSETYQARARLDKVAAGSSVSIEIKVETVN